MKRLTVALLSLISLASLTAAAIVGKQEYPQGFQGSAPGLPTAKPKAKPETDPTPSAPGEPDPQDNTPAPEPPAPAPSPDRKFIDGTFTGESVANDYGRVQVEISINGGEITSAYALRYPDGTEEARALNRVAIPQLNENALQAQGGPLNGVAGATATSLSYRDSLQSALDQALAQDTTQQNTATPADPGTDETN